MFDPPTVGKPIRAKMDGRGRGSFAVAWGQPQNRKTRRPTIPISIPQAPFWASAFC